MQHSETTVKCPEEWACSKSHEQCELVTGGGLSDATDARSTRSEVKLHGNHEEANIKLIFHPCEAANEGINRVLVICRDVDVMLLLVHCISAQTAKVWMISGKAKKWKCYPIHAQVVIQRHFKSYGFLAERQSQANSDHKYYSFKYVIDFGNVSVHLYVLATDREQGYYFRPVPVILYYHPIHFDRRGVLVLIYFKTIYTVSFMSFTQFNIWQDVIF